MYGSRSVMRKSGYLSVEASIVSSLPVKCVDRRGASGSATMRVCVTCSSRSANCAGQIKLAVLLHTRYSMSARLSSEYAVKRCTAHGGGTQARARGLERPRPAHATGNPVDGGG